MAKKAEMLKEYEPFEFLKLRRSNADPTFQEIKLLEDLSYVSKLNPEVINVLIDYVMLKQNDRLPYNYVMKIANSLANAGVNTTEEAMEYFYKIKDKYTPKEETQPKEEKVEKPVVAPSKKEVNEEDEEEEFERLKEARRKRKIANATSED